MRLQQIKFDFRDLLPNLDRRTFKYPFVASEVWEKLGESFNEKMWDRALRKYRVRITRDGSIGDEVTAEFFDEGVKVVLNIPENKWNVEWLKFQVIQTVMHELIHANQFYAHDEQYNRQYCKIKDPAQEYLGCFGEIQAFAHCCALDIMHDREDTILRYNESPVKVRKQLIRQIIRWVRNYDQLNSRYGGEPCLTKIKSGMLNPQLLHSSQSAQS